ncbi:MAG: HEAT repeat domain-containing protein, partial [Chitinophagaceae bacterium]|nr:HEAT repeat domain-containing protein [Chitinophagaceae bacterium]
QTKPNLRQLPTTDLVQLFAHRNQWWRLQAQKLVLERQDKSIVPALKKLFAENEDAAVRLHVFYALDGLESMNAELVRQAMNDKHPAVRKAGVEMAERFPETIALLQKAINDSSAQVAFQAVLSIGEFPSRQAIQPLSEAIKKYGENKWFRTAVLSSVPGSSMEFFELLYKQNYFSDKSKGSSVSLLNDLSFIIKKRNKEDEVRKLSEMLNSAGLTP